MPQQHRMNPSQKRALGTIAVVAILAWVTWPTQGQLNPDTCTPNGLIPNLSLAIHGEEFWRVQLADIARRCRSAENSLMRPRGNPIRC
jgi:hypothetical protein